MRIPNPERTDAGQRAKGSIWKEMKFGWEYILARRGLLTLLFFFMAINFLGGVTGPLFVPLILDTWKADVLGYLSTVMGVGMLAGTLFMSAWGGGRRKVLTLLWANALGSLFLVAIAFRTSIALLAVCGFGFMFAMPLTNAASQAIWQSKVAPDVQGRVFAVRRAIAWSAQLVAPLFAAPLVDFVFRPAMAPGGALAVILGPYIGIGGSRGVAVLISTLGLLTVGVTFVALANPRIRNIERDLPDHAASVAAS